MWSEQPFRFAVQDVVEPVVRAQLPSGFASFTDTRQLAGELSTGPTYANVLGHAQMVETTEGLTYNLPYHADGMIVLGSDYFDAYIL